jgi:hypothetical protein
MSTYKLFFNQVWMFKRGFNFLKNAEKKNKTFLEKNVNHGIYQSINQLAQYTHKELNLPEKELYV